MWFAMLNELGRPVQVEMLSLRVNSEEHQLLRRTVQWGFAVPALHIVGGGPTREDARRRAREAIAVALRTGVELDGPVGDKEFLDVRICRAPGNAN